MDVARALNRGAVANYRFCGRFVTPPAVSQNQFRPSGDFPAGTFARQREHSVHIRTTKTFRRDERTDKWRENSSGRVRHAPDDKWRNIDQALRAGHRGLDGGISLAKPLAKHRNKRIRKALPRYTQRKILLSAIEPGR